MSSHQVLNNIQHKDTKIINQYGAKFGDNIGTVISFPFEFMALHKEYPIFFRKDDTNGSFQAVAMLGFMQDRNLFLGKDDEWRANYTPAAIARGPFFIGFQNQSADNGPSNAPVIHIDMSHPKVNDKEGQAVFLEHGGNSPYLEDISKLLGYMMDGLEECNLMISNFDKLGLIEPIELQVASGENQVHKLHGNYTISQDALANLSAENLKALQNSGFLHHAYMMIASLSNIQKLVNWQNDLTVG
jgi:hypothetical protein